MTLFSKPEIHSVLLVDIASSSVGIGLSGIKDGALPELVFTVRIPFAHIPGFDLAHIEHAMMFALRDALGIAFREGTLLLKKKGFPTAINHSIISFSSPWFVSQLGGDQSEFISQLKRKFGGNMEPFGNDSGIHNAAEKRLVRKIEDEIIRTFGIKEGIGIENFSVVFSKVINHAFYDIEPAFFVDMSGHTTDVLSMNKGKYRENYSIAVGTHKLGAGIPWDEFWKKITNDHEPEFHSGNIFLIAEDYDLARRSLASALPRARIIPFSADNGFIHEMVVLNKLLTPSERLAILATYTNLFI